MIKIVLPSDSSPELYPDNTIGHYKARLSEPIMQQLNPRSTIALNAITYPTSTSSSNFYVTLPGLVRSPDSSLRSVVVESSTIKDDGLYTKRMVTSSFNHLIFMPLKSGAGDIREIEVDIIDPSTGETVKFKDRKLFCTFLITNPDEIYKKRSNQATSSFANKHWKSQYR